MKVTLLETEMTMWPPNTRHYVDEDGQHYAVHSDAAESIDPALVVPPEIARNVHTIIPCPTTIVLCDERGIASSLDALHTAEPCTSHEDALVAAGFEVQS